jgi:hypothetical protein
MQVNLTTEKPGTINPDNVRLEFLSRFGNPIRYYDDGWGPLWLCQNTMGVVGIIRCQSEAYEIWGDEFRKPIEEDEVHEAYGTFDRLVDLMVARGHENDVRLRRFCYSWAPVWFAAKSHLQRNQDGDWPDLIEGYEYQANSTGTGIVTIDLNGESLELLTTEMLERHEIQVNVIM